MTPLPCVSTIVVTTKRTNSFAAENRLRCLLLEGVVVVDDAFEEDDDDEMEGDIASLPVEEVAKRYAAISDG